jgi:hypothetical protein
MLAFALLVSLASVVLGQQQQRHDDMERVSPATKYHLKWVTQEPNLPIYLDKKLDPTSVSTADLDFKWYKYSQNIYLDELENFSKMYLFSQTEERAALYILEYNTRTHEQLSSYEPRLSPVDDENDEQLDLGNDLFTLAYLESQVIDIKEKGSNLVVYCNVSILMPNNNNLLNSINFKLIERNINIKLRLTESHGGGGTRQHERVKHLIREGGRKTKRNTNTNAIPKTFIQVNLDVGPIELPIRQLKSSNNPNVTCKLDLLDMEQNLVVYEKEAVRSIDPEVGHLDLPPPPQVAPPQVQASLPETKPPASINSDQNQRLRSEEGRSRARNCHSCFQILHLVLLLCLFVFAHNWIVY